MPNFLAFIAIVITLGVLYVTQIADKTDDSGLFPATTEQETVYQKVSPVIKKETKLEPSSSILINTKITAGPEEGQVFNDTLEVTFEFSAIVSPEQEKRIFFETKIEELDEKWEKTYSQKRKFTLPPGPKEYTFLVRAGVEDTVDLTPASRKFKINVSPYFGKVVISSKSSSGIVLRSYLKGEEMVNLTGWRVGGNKGNIIIPQAFEYYFPYGQGPPSDIILKPSDMVYLWNDSNPLGANKNFKPNKCFGFLTEGVNFKVSVPSSKKCPKIKLEDIYYLTETCQSFILSKMGSCKVPDYSNNLEVLFDSSCRTFIDNYAAENLNYQGCFQNYSKEDNFLENKWYVFAGKILAGTSHDLLYIYDKEGLLVDEYLY